MVLPSPATKVHLDAATDDPKQARSELATNVDKFNQLLTEVSAIGGNDLNGNALIIDADGDTYLQASSDDITVLTAGGIPFA